MKAQRSLMFGQIRPPTEELAALERLKNPHIFIIGKTTLPLFSAAFDRILFILTG